jgi:uncharacterized repeat protein (TIGR03803 family)
VRQLETRLTPSIITLASFDGTHGQTPLGGLIMDAGGNLYGTTEYGGASSDGTVFELAAGSGTITTLASFDGTNGSQPRAGLVMDGSGNLYGTTWGGGAHSLGTVFELAAGSGTITTLATFNGANGGVTSAGLILDGSGNLYGTTPSTSTAYGTVFELAAGSGTITTLASFNGTDGATPAGGVIMDASGNLYGTTAYGGPAWTGSVPSGYGTVFEVAKGSGTITTLASFDGTTNGRYPFAGLLMDAGGNLYGTTAGDFVTSPGTVFEVANGSGTITTLASFGTLGEGSEAGLVMDASGDLYGTSGALAFEVLEGSGTITTLAAPLAGPAGGGLLMDNSGNLYGTTTTGGASGLGTVFELPGAALPTDQWTGANSAVDTNWSDPANWSIGSPPYAGQTAIFTNNATVRGFTATVDANFTNPIQALTIDSTWGGTIAVNSPLPVTGDFTMGSGSLGFGGSGWVTIAGSASQWSGGQIHLGTPGFINNGTLNVDTTGGNLVLTGAGTFTNNGTITEAGTHNLILKKTAALDNAAGATFDLTDNGSITQSGGSTLTNDGTLEKTGGTGTSTISTTTLDNRATVAVTSGTLDISATVAQVSGKTLKAGTWTVAGSATVKSKLDITSAASFTDLGSAVQVTLSGPGATFSNLRGLRMIDPGALFNLLGGQAFATAGALTNKGILTVGAGSILTVAGNFTQTSTGTLTIGLGGTDTAPTFGQLVSSTGTVALAGHFHVTATVVPAVGSSFAVLDNEGNSAISGIFTGLPEGATFKVKRGTKTMTFQITYAGTDADGNQNVIITRIS